MADIICVIGNKGGTGKTTLSHMLAHGMTLLGHRSVCVLTDACREPLDPTGRSYLVADARSRDGLARVTDKIRSLRAWMGVIDGGGNRSEIDRRLYGLSDLVLLPFRESHRRHSHCNPRSRSVSPSLRGTVAMANHSVATGIGSTNHFRDVAPLRRPHFAAGTGAVVDQAVASASDHGPAATRA